MRTVSWYYRSSKWWLNPLELMTLLTNSSGILARKQMIEACFGASLANYSRWRKFKTGDACVGWGNKPSSRRMAAVAKRVGVPFIRLEDGFIGYAGHPASGGASLALIRDDIGIYYDSTAPSWLEQLIPQPLSVAELERSKQLHQQLIGLGITKYNCYDELDAHHRVPAELAAKLDGQRYIVLVDQVAGDQSLQGGLVSADDPLVMVQRAAELYPDAKLVVRAHPDTLQGNKTGLLTGMRQHPLLEGAVWFAKPCHPHGLLCGAEAVFTLTSQLGFEALLLGKPVFCFGLPFYAGWGLTQDTKVCQRRRQMAPEGVSIEQLLHAALVRYPRYYHPVLKRTCQVEDAIEIIRAQQLGAPAYRVLYLLGFSMWKRAFMGDFCRHLSEKVQFVSHPPQQLGADEKLLVWGNRFPELEQVLRVEDGFIRSAGLGSNLCRPSSVVIDDQSMYFNAQRPNRLRHLLNTLAVTPAEQERAEQLRLRLVEADISKYNLGSTDPYRPTPTNKPRLLVVGQVDGDASTVTGSSVIKTNEALLWAVREANPQAWIIYKPHPDVVAGNREGKISQRCLAHCVDEQVTEFTLNDLYPHVAALHTMTSLSGFEALLRGVPVVTWGQPFYAGWGLTEDKYPPEDRLQSRSLVELVFITLVKYPVYIDWDTGLYATPEWMVEKFSEQKAKTNQQQSRWHRWVLKLNYLRETLRKR